MSNPEPMDNQTVTAPPVTDQQLRDAGYTTNARTYPLSEDGARWVAKFNGIPFEKIPAAWWYAPNPEMQRIVEEEGVTDDRP